MERISGYIRFRKGKWTVEVRPNAGGSATMGFLKIWVGTFYTREEARWTFNAAEILTERKNYDAEAFEHHVFQTHNDLGCSYKKIVKRESRRYSKFRKHKSEANRFLNRLPGQPEILPPVVVNMAFTIISNELRAMVVGWNNALWSFNAAEDLVDVERWAVDAAEYLMERRGYNAEDFGNHVFRTHNDLGGAYRDFVVSESQRYVTSRKLMQLDSWLNSSPNQFDLPDPITLDESEEAGQGSREDEIRNLFDHFSVQMSTLPFWTSQVQDFTSELKEAVLSLLQ